MTFLIWLSYFWPADSGELYKISLQYRHRKSHKYLVILLKQITEEAYSCAVCKADKSGFCLYGNTIYFLSRRVVLYEQPVHNFPLIVYFISDYSHHVNNLPEQVISHEANLGQYSGNNSQEGRRREMLGGICQAWRTVQGHLAAVSYLWPMHSLHESSKSAKLSHIVEVKPYPHKHKLDLYWQW